MVGRLPHADYETLIDAGLGLERGGVNQEHAPLATCNFPASWDMACGNPALPVAHGKARQAGEVTDTQGAHVSPLALARAARFVPICAASF